MTRKETFIIFMVLLGIGFYMSYISYNGHDNASCRGEFDGNQYSIDAKVFTHDDVLCSQENSSNVFEQGSIVQISISSNEAFRSSEPNSALQSSFIFLEGEDICLWEYQILDSTTALLYKITLRVSSSRLYCNVDNRDEPGVYVLGDLYRIYLPDYFEIIIFRDLE